MHKSQQGTLQQQNPRQPPNLVQQNPAQVAAGSLANLAAWVNRVVRVVRQGTLVQVARKVPDSTRYPEPAPTVWVDLMAT